VKVADAIAIYVRSEAEAECLDDALAIYGCQLAEAEAGWTVRLVTEGPKQLVAVLDALQECLNANNIPSVKVDVAGQTYAMEAVP
jgi:hypothetical protein